MEINEQLLFALSIIGGLNGLLMSFYFAVVSKKNKVSTYFLSALLLAISVRVLKSTFFYFNPGLSGTYIQIGILACALIGPLCYLYIKSWKEPLVALKWGWHIVPISCLLILLFIFYPYTQHRNVWSRIIMKCIYLIWVMYIITAAFLLQPIIKKIFTKKKRLQRIEIWLFSVVLGVFMIWLGYIFGSYTSYIVGAVSATFVYYLMFLFWALKGRSQQPFFEQHIKYEDKKIQSKEAEQILERLHKLLSEDELYSKPNLKVAMVAKSLRVTPHFLSQVLNDNVGKSFSAFINSYRIEKAKKLLVNSQQYTTEAIGYQCGFNSKSTFFSVFKRITGQTPSNYRSDNQ